MKQIRFGIIEEYLWSEEHNEKSKHPQERLKELGIKIVIGIPESIADCWICLVEDFDFELPPYITVKDVDWEYFYYYCPDACKSAMIKCGIDYKPIEDKCKVEKQKEWERRNNNKKLFDKFTIKFISEVTFEDSGGNILINIIPDNDNNLFVIKVPYDCAKSTESQTLSLDTDDELKEYYRITIPDED